MRRKHLSTVVASAVLAVALTAGPAWAAPSFTTGDRAEAGDPDHAVTMQVPDAEGTGPTTDVVLRAPSGFVPSDCVAPVGWSCSVAEQQVTWSRGDALAQLGTFAFRTAVPAVPGTYAFPVRQAGTDGTVTWTAGNGAPAIIVDGEGPGADEEPGTEGEADPEPSPDSSTDPPPDGEQSSQDDSGTPASPAGPTATPSDDGRDASGRDTATADSNGGGTAPRRTEGRSNGTTLEITPADPAEDRTAPAVAAPDVADAPTSADTARPATGGDAAAAGLDVTADDRDGPPWQQLAGAALLVAAAALAVAQQWRARR